MKEDAKKLRNLLEEILDNIPDNSETGIMLSGGLDSSVLACILLNKGRTLRSISSSFKGFSMYDETEYVEMIKDKYSQLEINYVTPLDINLLNGLKELIGIIKEPIISGSAILLQSILKKAKQLGIKNLLYGQWPDELMGGYEPFLLAKARDDFLKLKISNALINIREYIKRSKMVQTDLILLRIIKTLATSKGLRIALNESIPNIKHLINIAQKIARSLEINLILPYADSKIIEFCQSLPPDRLVNKGQTKIILREAVADILPEGVLERRKKFGFFGPDAIWLHKNKDSIEKLKDKTVRKEYKKFLRNPKKRWYKKLWIALSNLFLKK